MVTFWSTILRMRFKYYYRASCRHCQVPRQHLEKNRLVEATAQPTAQHPDIDVIRECGNRCFITPTYATYCDERRPEALLEMFLLFKRVLIAFQIGKLDIESKT